MASAVMELMMEDDGSGFRDGIVGWLVVDCRFNGRSCGSIAIESTSFSAQWRGGPIAQRNVVPGSKAITHPALQPLGPAPSRLRFGYYNHQFYTHESLVYGTIILALPCIARLNYVH